MKRVRRMIGGLGLAVPALCGAGLPAPYPIDVSAPPDFIAEAQLITGTRLQKLKKKLSTGPGVFIVEFRIANAGAEAKTIKVSLAGNDPVAELDFWAADSIRRYPRCAAKVPFDPPGVRTPESRFKESLRCFGSVFPRIARMPIPKAADDKLPPNVTETVIAAFPTPVAPPVLAQLAQHPSWVLDPHAHSMDVKAQQFFRSLCGAASAANGCTAQLSLSDLVAKVQD